MNAKLRMLPVVAILALMALWLAWGVSLAATPPLLPFDNTGDLYVLEHGTGNIIRITSTDGQNPTVSVAIKRTEIMTVTGSGDVSFADHGIAFDAAGNLYFTENFSNMILKKPKDGALQVLSTKAMLNTGASTMDADPEGLAFGADGFLYVLETTTDSILRVNPSTGVATSYVTAQQIQQQTGHSTVSLQAAVAGAEENVLYVTSSSSGSPKSVYRIGADRLVTVLKANATVTATTPFNMLDRFMTRAANGDLIIADNTVDNSNDRILRVTPAGVVSTFLTNGQISAAVGTTPSLDGGIAFDSSGNFYAADNNMDAILRFPSGSTNGTMWVTSSDIVTALNEAGVGGDPNLKGGIAFAPVLDEPAPPAADLSLTKDAAESMTVGENLTYTLTVSNAGPDGATGVTLTDTLPASVTFVSASSGCTNASGTVTCNLGAVASGGQQSVEIVVRPNSTATVTNNATVAGNEVDPNEANNSDSATTVVSPVPGVEVDLALTKVASAQEVQEGEQLTYTLTVNNRTGTPATEVIVVDTLPEGVTFLSASQGCSEADGTVTCELGTVGSTPRAVQIVVRAETAGTITNQASVQANESDPAPGNNSASVSTTVTEAPPEPPTLLYLPIVVK